MSNAHDPYEIKHEFAAARRKAFLGSLFSVALGRSPHPVPFEEARRLLRPTGESFQGRMPVPLDKVVGSEGRYSDFDRQFLPRKEHVSMRWESIALAFKRDVPLPAIQVYQLGGLYFVRDGNHRVSVARSRGMAFLDADVTSLNTEIDVSEAATIDEIRSAIVRYERECFVRALDALDVLPGDSLSLTSAGGYEDLVVHIACHRIMLEGSAGRRVSYQEATRSWYDGIYTPLAKLIGDSGVLTHAEGRTVADFYVWLVRHWDDIPVATDPRPRLRRRFISFLRGGRGGGLATPLRARPGPAAPGRRRAVRSDTSRRPTRYRPATADTVPRCAIRAPAW